MRLQDLLIALLVSGVVMTIVVMGINDAKTNYDLNVTTAEDKLIGKFEASSQNLTADVGTLEHNITSNLEGAKVDITDQFSAFVSAAFGSVRLVLTSTMNGPQLAYNMVRATVQELGIPVPVAVLGMVLSLLMIPVAFVIISAIFKHPL